MGNLALFAIGVGLSILSSYLLRPKSKKGNLGEDTPTTLATRGSYVPLLIGKRKIGHVFAWAGNRKSRSAGGGGKKGGGGSFQEWFEDGWHLLSVGAGIGLYEIRFNNEIVWSGELTSDTHPSGTAVTIAGKGTFYVFWGELDQEPFEPLVQATGIRSGWPGVLSVFWKDVNLGGSPNWPTVEYVAKALCIQQSLEDSDLELDDTASVGYNPAHLAFILMRGSAGYGAGLALGDIDQTSIEAFGEVMQSEHLPMNLLGEAGETVSTLLQSLALDCGAFVSQHDNRLLVEAMRTPTVDTPTLSDDVISPPNAERQVWRGRKTANLLIFGYSNELENYRIFDVPSQDAADRDSRNAISPEEIDLGFVTHPDIAKKVANRREQESLSQTISVKFEVLRGAALLRAGKVFQHSFGQMRVISMRPIHDSPKVEIEAIVDVYSVPEIADEQDTPVLEARYDVENDLAFSFVQLPAEDSSVPAIVVFRIPAHQEVVEGNIYGSIDAGSNYKLIGTQANPAIGGQIESTISASTADTITTGPVFEDANGLVDRTVLDLTGDDPGWQAGEQVALINDEVFFVRSLSVQSETAWAASTAKSLTNYVIPSLTNGLRYECTTAGTTGATEPVWPRKVGETVEDGTAVWTCRGRRYQINDMIRARKGTAAEAHAIDDWVYIIPQANLSPITDSIIAAGNSLCVKSVPETRSQIADITTITAVCKDLFSVSTDPLLIDDSGNYIVTHVGDRIKAN
jgi:hypothetical protein